MWRYLLVILTIPLLFACAKRKIDISKHEEKVDSVVTEKKDSVATKQTAITINEETDEIEVTPIDTSKPITIGDKQYFNAVVKIKKTKRKLVDSSKTTVAVAQEKKAEVKKKQKTFKKAIDKKPSYFSLWWLLIIPVVVWLVRRYLLK